MNPFRLKVLVKNNPRHTPPPREPALYVVFARTPLWHDPTLWAGLLLLLLLAGGVLYLGSYTAEYSAAESTLAWATPEYPVGVLHTPDHAYVLGGGTLSRRDQGFRVVMRPWGGFVTPVNGRGRMKIIATRKSHLAQGQWKDAP